jgi:hypothetical protein
MSINVQVLFADGCPHASSTIEMIKDVSAKLKLDILLESIRVADQEHAREINFLGSPTIRINGLDIDPSARSAVFSGFT